MKRILALGLLALSALTGATPVNEDKHVFLESTTNAEVEAENAMFHEVFVEHGVNVNPRAQVNVPLERSTVADIKRTAILQNLKLRQRDPTALITIGDEPLRQQLLSEKHLATYYGQIKIRRKNFRVLFDTGSCEFWVPSDECKSDRCMHHERYPMGHEKFKLASDPELNIQYLSGRVAGEMVLEDVTVENVVVPSQVVGLAKVVDIELLDDVVWDGILGLAYPNPALEREGIVPLFDNIIRNDILKRKNPPLANQFAYYIDDTKGALTMGGANCRYLHSDPRSCASKFQFAPVTEQTYWTVRFTDVIATYPDGSKRDGNCPPQGCTTIVDTGTYLIYGPEDQVSRMIYSGDGGCGQVHSLPDITFMVFAGPDRDPIPLTLTPRDYVLKFQINNKDDCVTGISPDRDVIWTLGQVFLRSFYTLFDRDQNRIGFARVNGDKFSPINKNELAGSGFRFQQHHHEAPHHEQAHHHHDAHHSKHH